MLNNYLLSISLICLIVYQLQLIYQMKKGRLQKSSGFPILFQRRVIVLWSEGFLEDRQQLQLIINRQMQIVSEALFEKLKQPPIIHTSSHNRIAFLTPHELVVRQITLNSKCCFLKLKGQEVAAISLQNPNFLVLLYKNGKVEVRRVEQLKDVVRSGYVPLKKNGPLKLRVSSECVYVLNHDYIEVMFLNVEKGQKKVILQDSKEQPLDLLISTIFEEEIILVQFPTSIAITAEGKNIAEASFQTVDRFKLLKSPLVAESKQFLVIMECRKYLKVFDIFDLEPILEMEIYLQEEEDVELKVDPLYEYLMVRILDSKTNSTHKNSLMKINQDFYRGAAKEPFFLFDIEIGLKHDFILYPTHTETIQNTPFTSIDMCFFHQKEIRIATLVVDIHHRTKLHNANFANSSWTSNNTWKDFFFNTKAEEDVTKKESLEYSGGGSQDDWQTFLQKFYQENLQKLKCEGYYKFNPSKQEEEKKYLEYQKHQKDILENEDALNTLSGSSSFGSLREMPTHVTRRQPFLEDDYSSAEQELRSKQEDTLEHHSINSQDSETDEYLKRVEGEVLKCFDPLEQQICKIDEKLDRVETIHLRKLKSASQEIKRHQKETSRFEQNVEKWCEEQFADFGASIKGSLKQFSASVGRLQIIQIRYLKRLKKHYRDYLQVQVEKWGQRLEESQKHLQEIEKIGTKQERL